MREAAALVIFLATVLTMVARPSKIPEWLACLIGAIIMVVAGVESGPEAWRAVATQWDVLLFFAGLMTIVAVAESAGFFSWVAFLAARAAHGSARRLFLGVLVTCTAITVVLTNDAAALVMTPLVFVLASGLRLRPLPFAFACTFMANGASLILPISNPVNIIIAESSHLTLSRYLSLLWLSSATAAIFTAVMLWLALGQTLRRQFEESQVRRPEGDPQYRSEVTALLAIAAAALVTVTATGGLVGVAASLAAVILLVHGAVRRRLDTQRVMSDANPSIVVLVASLFALAEGVANSGLLSAPVRGLLHVAELHPALAGAATAIAAAIGSNVFNNLPTATLAVATLHHPSVTAALAPHVAAGAIIGCDLGPNLTTVGSLSTMLWLVLLRRRGLEISSLEYVKLGLLVAPIALVAAIAALFVTAR